MKKTNSWNRLLSMVLCLCMVLSLIPALQWPVSAVGASAPVVDGSHIYAQGTPLYIVAGTSSGTAIYYLNGSKKVYLNSNGAAGDDMSGTMVWGGYHENALDGDVNITMTGGKISRINGTGYDYYNTAGGYVNNVNITISGGTVSDAINAGWRNPVNGNVNITMTGGSVGKIYGCCSFSQASVGNADVKVRGNVNLRITGGSVSTIHGGDGYNPVHGTVTAVVLVPTNLVHYGISMDKAYYFDNVLYLNDSIWTQKGSVTLNAGETLTVAAGQTLTLKGSLTNKGTIVNNGTVNMSGAWTNNGTFINNGTLNKTYAISGNAIQNSGTVNYNAAYIEGISSVSSISAKMDGNAYSLSSDMYQVVSGRLYVWLPSGNAEVTVNGSKFYGITASGKQTKLTSYVGVNGITGIPGKIDANRNYTLSASVLPETGIIFPQTVTYELVSSTAPGTTLTDGVLYAAGAGSAKIRITARDSYVTYSTTVDIEVLFTPVTGLTKALDDVIYTGAYELPGVTPGDASYSGIVWTVVSAGTTGATINGNTLTTTGTGTLKLRGTVQNGLAYGSNYVVEKTMTVKTIDYIDLTYGSVSISKKDDTTVTVTYTPFGGDGTRDYSVNERIYITGTSTENHITVVSGNPKIALSNVNLNLWAFEEKGDPGAFHIASGANVDLELIGTNTLKSGYWNAGLSVPSGASVVIGGDGALNAYGGGNSAGIGGSHDNNCGTVTINSGTITAASCAYENDPGSGSGSGIGGGYQAAGGTITINGGNVFAKGDSGIGSGANGYNDRVGTVTINGGTVFASAQPGSSVSGAAIGGGYRCAGYNVIINGGSVKTAAYRTHIGAGLNSSGRGNGTLKDSNGNAVTLHTFTLNGAAADTAISAVSGISYGINDVRTQDTDKLYFYLPSGSAMPDYFTAGDTIYCGGENNVYSAETHSPGKTYFIDGNTHYNKCSVCDSVLNVTEHSGGVADCLHEGTCQFCGAAYLPVDPNNHTSTDTYLEYIDDEYHGTFRACCKAEVSRTEHTAGQVATCTGTAICADCGIAYGATDSANHTGQLVYVSNGKQNHIQIWDCCRTPNATPEPHTLTYTADGLTITGICDFCDANGKVTLKPSVGGTYNGYAFTSTYEGADLLGSWDAFVKPTVSYCCEGGCKTAGTHTVTMTLGEASVSAEFTITPKTLTIGLVNANHKSYDGTSDLSVYSVSLDGVVVYDEGDYSGAWDDIRDDVQLVRENLVYTFDGIVPGTYSSVDVSGVTITGNDASNYVIAESFEDVPLRNSMGYDFEISNAEIWITAYDQLLTGDAELDQSQYAVEGLEDQFTLQGVSLYENSYSEIEIDPYSIGIYLDGEDVTEYFNITVHNGILSRVCEGHEYDENGFCATGECNSYEPAVKNATVDEWGNEIEVYEIYNAGQLYWFAEQVNTYGNNYINGKLMADITVNEDLTAENLRQWTPIGRAWPAYCAIFEGNDHTISGLYVNDPEMDYVGLFGYTDYAYPFSNIHLTNSYFEGNSCVGGLFGYAGSNISGCTVSDSVTVKGNNSLGGIVGDTAYGELNNSWSAATVIANENAYYYGGLVGYNNLSINNCYTTGSSLVGVNNDSYGGSVNNSYYLSEEETEDGGKTAAQFASGEVAYLLQSGILGEEVYDEETDSYITLDPEHIWGQYIGEEAYPVLGGAKVYEVTNCKNEISYSNTNISGHAWTNATCTAPKTCTTCGATEGEALGHDWTDATCTEPKTCTVCGATEGEALGHDWTDATCTEPKTCIVCGVQEGDVDADNHTGTDYTYEYYLNRDFNRHEKFHACCGVSAGMENHSYNEQTGLCNECGAEILISVEMINAPTEYLTHVEYALRRGGRSATLLKDHTNTKTYTVAVDALYFAEGVTLTNNGTLTLPETFTYDTIPSAITGGTVIIGESTYIWNGSKYICVTHSYENDVCTVCGHIGVPVKLQTAALSFKEKIHYNIFFSLGVEENVALSDMGLIMFDSLKEDGTMDDAIATYSGAVEMNGMYMVATDGVHAKRMGDTIYFRAYAKLADGSYVYSKTVQYSAVTYAEHILGSDKPDSDKALVVAMLNYGAEAQKYFGYNTDSLANATLTAEQQALVKDYQSDLLAPVTKPDSSKAGIFAATGTGFGKLAPAVSFEGRFVLNYFFTPSEAVAGDMTLYYWTQADYEAATELTAENASGSIVMLPGEQYRGIVDGIHAKDVDSVVYVAAVYSDGTTTHCTGVLAYSIGAYLTSHAAKETNFQAMAQAAAVYCSYCKEYFYG